LTVKNEGYYHYVVKMLTMVVVVLFDKIQEVCFIFKNNKK